MSLTGHCKRCSYGDRKTYHGVGNRCENDPTLPANIIVAHFQASNPVYIGIVWKAIANGAVQALEDARYKIVEPKRRSKKA
jgi:hypothetical protein